MLLGGYDSLKEFLLGTIAMGDLIAALFFLKYWKITQDRLFLFFALSFALNVVCRVLLIHTPINSESEPLVYSLRVLSYAAILVGILNKNRVVIGTAFFKRAAPFRRT